MQVLDPLAIGDVALTARYVLYMLGVDEEDLKPASLEDLE
jgi:hypothetical protein